MLLSKWALSEKRNGLKIDIDDRIFTLPERVLQFGTGVLMRGLPDYYIDKANKAGIFNGRIVVVKSTPGSKDDFDRQDGLFTHCIRGIQNNEFVKEEIVNASISRVLNATHDWHDVLSCASNPEMNVIISNTTEAGISLINDNVHGFPPASFPGKLLAFLYQRYKVFNGDPGKGMVIIPTELIPNNAEVLLSILLELAHQNGFESNFIDWLENANEFCNSLVDCIVPGKLNVQEKSVIEKELNYEDELMILSEPYRLWAIETSSPKVKEILSFANADDSMVITSDISTFRELKLRLLNGIHTFCCGLAHLAGFKTVVESMQDEVFSRFVNGLMYTEIIPAITSAKITEETATKFAGDVINRFNNPFVEHKWMAISVQYAAKMNLRNVPVLTTYINKFGSVPKHMAICLAAHILFMKSSIDEVGNFYGSLGDVRYPITDEHARYYHGKWRGSDQSQMVFEILSNTKLWGTDLAATPGLANSVNHYLNALRLHGALRVMKEHILSIEIMG